VKTQIIRLEEHDDVISIKDKMGWGQTPRILLVWPSKETLLGRRLDLVFLKRHAQMMGAQLAFVTNDPNVRYFARKLSIPVYSNIRRAEESHWRRPRRARRKQYPQIENSESLKPKLEGRFNNAELEELRQSIYPKPVPWLFHPLFRLLFFTLGVIGVMAVAATLVPSAVIRISPYTTWNKVTLSVIADPAIEFVDLSGIVPARKVSVIVEGRGSIPSTGNIAIPEDKAQGWVVFTNITDEQISVPRGTIVSTSDALPVRFSTLSQAVIAPKANSDRISIEAIDAGKSGNLISRKINAIEGPLGLHLTVTNPIGTSKGSQTLAPAPTEGDYQSLLKKMLPELEQTAILELSSSLGEDDLLISTQPEDYMILEETYSPSDIQPADQLTLALQVEYTAYVSSGEDLLRLGKSVLEANLPEGYSPIPSTLDINNKIDSLSNDPDKYTWEMEATWELGATIDDMDAVELVLWRTPDDAISQLIRQLPIENNVVITMAPDWWPRLPILPFRVAVVKTPN